MVSTEEQFSFSSWKPMFSGSDRVFVSAAQKQHPRRLTIRLQFPPDGTSTVRPILDPGKRMEILRAVLSDNLHLPQKPTTEESSADDDDDDDDVHCLKPKQPPQVKPNLGGTSSGLEMKLEASKRKLHQHYQAIDDHKRRKRIKLVDIRDAPIQLSPQKPTNNFRRRVMIRRRKS